MSDKNKIEKDCIKNLSLVDLQTLMEKWGEPKYRAEQIFRELYAQRAETFTAFKLIPKKLKTRLKKEFIINSIKDFITRKSSDGTVKYLFNLVGGNSIESVLIPSYDNNEDDETIKRLTLCVSSQVGCGINCMFCATGKLKLTRNLTAAEIVDQVLNVEADTGLKVTNVVFMGMGEPLQNFDNVVKAIEILTNDINPIVSSKKITVSTAGIVPKIKILLEHLPKPVKLAISLHSTTNGLRDKLIPVNTKWNIESLRQVIEDYYRKTKLPITYEYILFKGLNDSDDDMKRLAKFVRSIPSKINIIPYHDISFIETDVSGLKAATISEIEDFVRRLRNEGANAFVRTSSGFDIDAACGQLAFSERKP